MESLECNFREQGVVREITQARSTPWFNQYLWSVSWHQPEISALRAGYDPFKIHKVLASRRHWEKSRYDGNGVWARSLKPSFQSRITPVVERHVIVVADFLAKAECEHKIVLNTDTITVYTNSADFVKSTTELAQSLTLGIVTVKTADLCLPPDTIVLKRHYDYQYRTWFRSRELTDHSKQVLKDWISNMGKHVYACPSLRRWLAGKSQRYALQQQDWTLDHYFVDHNDSKLDVWMAMVCPGIVRKTESIQSPAK